MEDYVLIADLIEPSVAWSVDQENMIIVGDKITVSCTASIYSFQRINWYRNNVPLTKTDSKLRVSNFK